MSERTKAYCVPLKGGIVREFLVYANSAAEAREIMLGDRESAEAMSVSLSTADQIITRLDGVLELVYPFQAEDV
jgi:hypothetical protein